MEKYYIWIESFKFFFFNSIFFKKKIIILFIYSSWKLPMMLVPFSQFFQAELLKKSTIKEKKKQEKVPLPCTRGAIVGPQVSGSIRPL